LLSNGFVTLKVNVGPPRSGKITDPFFNSNFASSLIWAFNFDTNCEITPGNRYNVPRRRENGIKDKISIRVLKKTLNRHLPNPNMG
jgi:hypothetical protein